MEASAGSARSAGSAARSAAMLLPTRGPDAGQRLCSKSVRFRQHAGHRHGQQSVSSCALRRPQIDKPPSHTCRRDSRQTNAGTRSTITQAKAERSSAGTPASTNRNQRPATLWHHKICERKRPNAFGPEPTQTLRICVGCKPDTSTHAIVERNQSRRLNTSVPLVPPKPKELERTDSTRAWRAVCGT